MARGVKPWLFLFLAVPRGEVDVNVHPGKSEVRFNRRRGIEEFVEASVREALEGIDSAAAWGRPATLQVVREGGGGPGHRGPAATPDEEDGAAAGDTGVGGKAGTPDDPDIAQMLLFRARASDGGDVIESGETLLPGSGRPSLLQIHNSFILAETRDGVIIVDQHAAHERVLYERIIHGFESGDGEGQRLLFPFTIRLTKPELDVIESMVRPLARLGFEVSLFGHDAILVQAVPSPHRYFDAERCVREMIHELTHGSDLMRSARNQNERVAMSFACKGAVKAGQGLGPRGDAGALRPALCHRASLPRHPRPPHDRSSRTGRAAAEVRAHVIAIVDSGPRTSRSPRTAPAPPPPAALPRHRGADRGGEDRAVAPRVTGPGRRDHLDGLASGLPRHGCGHGQGERAATGARPSSRPRHPRPGPALQCGRVRP